MKGYDVAAMGAVGMAVLIYTVQSLLVGKARTGGN